MDIKLFQVVSKLQILLDKEEIRFNYIDKRKQL